MPELPGGRDWCREEVVYDTATDEDGNLMFDEYNEPMKFVRRTEILDGNSAFTNSHSEVPEGHLLLTGFENSRPGRSSTTNRHP